MVHNPKIPKHLDRSKSPDTAKIVTCPGCGGDSLYGPQNAYRPFCSKRCKQIDLGAWANEGFRVPAEAPADDQPYEDARLQ